MVSSFFADIFKNNALNNGVLPVTVSDSYLEKLFRQDSNTTLTVDLEKQTITIDNTGDEEHFDINDYKKTCLLNGYSDIDYLLSIKDDILKYENEKAF